MISSQNAIERNMDMKRILRNAARCRRCGDVIESVRTHDFVRCSCGAIFVDGGLSYLRRGFMNSPSDIEDLSEFEGEDEYNNDDTLQNGD